MQTTSIVEPRPETCDFHSLARAILIHTPEPTIHSSDDLTHRYTQPTMLQADTFADLPIADLVVQMTTGNDFDTIYGVLGSYRTFSTSRQLLEELRARYQCFPVAFCFSSRRELFVRNRSQLARNR